MITLHLSNGDYRFSVEAFGRRLMNICNDRGWTSLAQAQAAVSSMAFTATGWRTLKKALGDLLLGSIVFPNELGNGGTTSSLTDQQVADRDISTGIT